MADRPTSVSKHVDGLHEDENVLDRETPLKDKFTKTSEEDRRAPRPKGPEREGSKMVREDAPGLTPTPTGRMRRVPDRFAAIRKLEQDRKEAAAQNEVAVKGWQKFQERQREGAIREQDNEREKTPVYGNPQEREPEKGEKDKEKTPDKTPEQAWEKFQKRQQEIAREQDHGREREHERER
jgi:hypothetical protein